LNDRIIAFLLLFILLSARLDAQKISIEATEQPLSEVLIQLRDGYNMSFSFDDAALRKFRITLNKTFKNPEEALTFITKDLPLDFEKSGDVWIIFPAPEKPNPLPQNKSRLISGQIQERKTLESLPYSNIVINGQGTISDADGYFTFRSTDTVFNLSISQLGYYRIDTTLAPGRNYKITMVPAVESLKEIVITDRLLETFVYTESRAGILHLNHKVTKFLPGSSDNSVFNLLRLQSGILAAAESSDNLIIWGAYEGQSRILFDDFLLFGLKNFNDNISAVNPYVVKNIKVLKAGFDASYGDCVGGIADITGIDGNKIKLGADVSLNNYTVNSMLQTPIGERGAFLLAFRHTYHDLYDNKNLDPYKRRGQTSESGITVIPDYVFRDLNLKYTFRNDNGFHFRTSLLTGQDNFSYSIDEAFNQRFQLLRETSETNIQQGASFVMGKDFYNGLNLKLTLTYSALNSKFNNEQEIINNNNGNLIKQELIEAINKTKETTAELSARKAINKNHQIEGAFKYTANRSIWKEDSSGVQSISQNIVGAYATIILQDQINLGRFTLLPGLRFSYLPYLNKNFTQPRLSISYKFGEHINFSLASGLYNQYLSKSSVQDQSGNYRYMWTLANDSTYPVLRGKHLTASLTFERANTQAALSPYYKKTKGMTRYVNFSQIETDGIFKGQGRSYGFDVYVKQNFKGHTAWLSYTWSKTEELFDHFPDSEYRFAPQDQRHEIKLATLLNFDPFYFSANYVYGSGFPVPDYNQQPIEITRTPYHRFDVALTYKFNFSKFYGEAGISVLNIFDRENLLYNNLERVPASQTTSISIYEQSVPFTPTIYIKLGF